MPNATTFTASSDFSSCNQYSELITAFVDGELHTEEETTFRSHLHICSRCQSSYEAEIATKNLIHTAVPPLKTPWRVRADIIEKIRIEAGVEKQQNPSPVFLWWKPSLAFGGALALFLISFLFFFNQEKEPPKEISILQNVPTKVEEKKIASSDITSSTASIPAVEPLVGTSQANVLEESMTDFDLYLQGKKKPKKTSRESNELQQFLSSRVNFPVKLPQMKDCELLGGDVQEYGSERIAKVMYSHRGQAMTLYQTSLAAIDEGDIFFLPESIRTILKEGSWYVDKSDPKCCVTMWVESGTLFYAVSNANSQEIMQELSTGFQTVSKK
ncbi:MAG: zf-HC2 domain-containing protein [Ignavibacteriales bacterium]|nr:zf-HC2 domain-containing protein [Ignavibacteriales bacterium]